MKVELDGLPESVRSWVIRYAAQALGAMPAEKVPTSLRSIAQFAPRRRAALGGDQILGMLQNNGAFGDAIAVLVCEQHLDIAAKLGSGEASATTAALSVLKQSDGWETVVDSVRGQEEAAAAESIAQGPAEELDKVRARLSKALAENAERRSEFRLAQQGWRSDQAELRASLSEARAEVRELKRRCDEAVADANRSRSEHAGQLAQADVEVRRAKSRISSLEADLRNVQRNKRVGKDEATMRARLLLDALLEAGQGLRKELGLPVAEGSPADAVATELEARAAAQAPSTPNGAGGLDALSAEDPKRLNQLLDLPRMHLIVDGYNVTKSAWGALTLEVQRNRLLQAMAPLAARSGAEVSVVFDGQHVQDRLAVRGPRGVRVLFSPQGVLADDVIRDLVTAEPQGRPVVVVTSDREIVRDVTRRSGVRAVASAALVQLLS